MNVLGNLKLATKMSLLVGVFLVGFLTFALVSHRTLETVRVKGPIYDRVVEGKDLIADVLPPPEYIIESYLLVHEMSETADKAQIDDLIERGNALRRQYDERQAVWVRQLEPGPLREAMIARSY